MAIKYGQYQVNLEFGKYGNFNTAIILKGAKGKYQGETIAVATVNGCTTLNDPDICGFKSWNENPEIINALIKGEIIKPAPVFTEPSGFGFIQYHELTEIGKQMRDFYWKEQGILQD